VAKATQTNQSPTTSPPDLLLYQNSLMRSAP
jgi:hypothetical protein